LSRMNYNRGSADEVERLVREALPLLEAAGDDDGLAHLWYARAWVANIGGRMEDWAYAAEQSIRHARRAGRPVLGFFVMMLSVALAEGPRPADEALLALDAVLADEPLGGSFMLRGVLLAMLDRIDEAWAVALSADERFRELGILTGGEWLAEVALIAGDYEAAESYLRDACAELEANGNTGELSSYAAQLGRVLCLLGRHDEAELLAQRGRELGDSEDVWTQQLWRQAQALVLSARGQHHEAERLAREAIDFSLRSDSPLRHGETLRDLAEVLTAAGETAAAREALEQSLECYERKRNLPAAARVRALLEQLKNASRSPRTIDPGSQA
jgi:tetratricopeptide (TPR) repeat protein